MRRSTRRTGRFEYQALLPADVRSEEVSVTLHDGVLTVTVPRHRPPHRGTSRSPSPDPARHADTKMLMPHVRTVEAALRASPVRMDRSTA
ncbi:Hsp20/alpha crystallin family protein [Streptomyces monashensis]|uniref:Hsp20/alpha crystallin family protein n=1 Tax=Streptomyces monashensis TaxID=1678012 RepID=UPI0031845AD4